MSSTMADFVPETYADKAERKFKENPWVPLGAVATTAALVMAMVRMRAGDSKSFNHWLRMRVVFQGVTIAAVCAGTYSFGLRKNPNAEQLNEEERHRREEKANRERWEFEMRMKEAEETHEAEAGFAKAVSDNKGRGSSLTQEEKVARERTIRKNLANRGDSEDAHVGFASTTSPPQQNSGGWKSWFGL